jgi:hypothetical protein
MKGMVTTLRMITALAALLVPAVSAQTPATGTLSGRVLTLEGTPMSGIRVAALEATRGAAAQSLMSLAETDAEGRYRLENLPPGSYLVVVGTLDDPVYFPGVLAREDATAIAITAGARLVDRDFRLKAPLRFTIAGTVVRDGNPNIREVVIQSVLQREPQKNMLSMATSIAADGSFAALVPPGTYSVRVTLPSFPAPITVVVADRDVTGLQIAPTPPVVRASVRFAITVDGGGLVPRFGLRFTPADADPEVGRSNREWLAGMAGASHVEGIPVGRYFVSWPARGASWALPRGYYIKSITSGDRNLRYATEPIDIVADRPLEIVVTLGVYDPAPWVQLKGKVTGMDAAPPARTITISGPPLIADVEVPVSADGAFELPMILPGEYTAKVNPSADPFPRTIVVNGNSNPAVVEVLRHIPSFRVVGGTARPADVIAQGLMRSNFQLVAILQPEGRGQFFESAVRPDGSFEILTVPPGSYRLTINSCAPPTSMRRECGPISAPIRVDIVDKNVEGLNVPIEPRPANAPRGGG